MVNKPILIGLIGAVGIGTVIIATVYAYMSSFQPQGAADGERTSAQHEQNDGHIVIPQKSYSQALWAQTGSISGKQVSTSFTLSMCDLGNVRQFKVPGADSSNPILLTRNGPEVKVEFCATSFDRQAITWELMARDADVLHDYQAGYNGALEGGVNVSFDKNALQMPAYAWNTTVSDNPEPPNLEQFSIYISADKNTKLANTDFQVLAIRNIDDDGVQIQWATVNIKVVGE